MSAESSSRVSAPGALQGQTAELLAPRCKLDICNSCSTNRKPGQKGDVFVQLEAAAHDYVQRFTKQDQDGENQPVADLQVFLHSSAHFGPAGMRELVVCKPSLLLLFLLLLAALL